jgi:hypothetical protein
MSDRIRDLLGEVADGVEPGDRLEEIRAATAEGGRRTHRGWWAAGGAGLVAASVVTALALGTGGTPQEDRSQPAGPAPTSSAPASANAACCRAVPVYFVGDTPDGPRLFRELRAGDGPESAETFALDAALRGDSLDPDYRSPWPDGAVTTGYLMHDQLLTVSLSGDVHDRPAGMDAQTARLAIEQLVRTAQGAFDSSTPAVSGNERVPVRLLIDNQPTDQVLGVPASEPLTAGSDLAVLSHVSLSDPSEGQVVDNDDPFTVTGEGNSYEGTIVTRIQRWEGTYIVDEQPATAGWDADRLFPFEVTFDLTGVAPGDYVVISRTDDPSGAGRFDTDTRRITIVD